jgi:hypothetical protein
MAIENGFLLVLPFSFARHAEGQEHEKGLEHGLFPDVGQATKLL